MATLNAYSLYDRKALTYQPPFYTAADGAAVRMVADLANDANTMVGRHPGDFVLYAVGVYDDRNGALVPHSPLIHVIDAASLVKIQNTLPVFEPPHGDPLLVRKPNGEDK